MRKKREPKPDNTPGDSVVCRPIEVTIQECNGDVTRMIKRFTKKIRKEEILKPYYGRIMFFETKSQKRRRQKLKGVYEWRKKEEKLQEE